MYWYDGRLCSEVSSDDVLASSPFNDAGLRFGASVFTTMRVYEQRLDGPRSQFSAHCDRLSHSIRAFGWQPPNWPSIHKGCQSLLQHYPVIRITLFPDGSEWITGRALPPELSTQQKEGISCWIAPATYARSLPTHKTGNYLACWLARQQAQKHGTQEAILTNARGDWLETATGNLWGWGQGQWWTPAVTDAADTFKKEYKDNVEQATFLLHLCSKLFESIIYDDLYKYLKTNSIPNINQSGFRTWDSCVNQLISITQKTFNSFDTIPTLEVRELLLKLLIKYDLKESFSNLNQMGWKVKS